MVPSDSHTFVLKVLPVYASVLIYGLYTSDDNREVTSIDEDNVSVWLWQRAAFCRTPHWTTRYGHTCD